MKVHELFAYLHVKDAAKAIVFYKEAFGAEEKFRLTEPGGRIGHAELVFNGTTLMLSDEFPEYGRIAYLKGEVWIDMSKEQLALALQLIESTSADFDPAQFTDRYQDSLMEVIKAKIQGSAAMWRSRSCRLPSRRTRTG